MFGSALVISIVPASSAETSSSVFGSFSGSGQTTFQARCSFSSVQLV